MLILHALILVSNILIRMTYSLYELLFQKYLLQAWVLEEIAPERNLGWSLIKGGGRPAAAEGEQQRRTTESVIRIVGNAFPHHSADQHRREEGEQGG
ncbi:hypothetical protein EAO28_01125 [Klebsiella pneumoniae]|uniref:Uncharacterized protein n=1 Tax=Klebsiella pneumoniae TaxID=573 RepID=A0A3P2EJB1_KLEPN|nr:hypothetical protein EAO28_01125 [Klebsiella pneumoniae]